MTAACHETFRSLVKQAETRCHMLSMKPSLQELGNQFVIQTQVLPGRSTQVELELIRDFFQQHVRLMENSVKWDTPAMLPKWVMSASPEEARMAQESFSLGKAQCSDYGKVILESYVKTARYMGIKGDNRSIAIQLAFYADQKSYRVSSRWKHLRPIEKGVLDTLDSHFFKDCPVSALFRLGEKAIFSQAMLRMFPRVIWLTGMRPIDLWTSQLYLPAIGGSFCQNDAAFAYVSPFHSNLSGSLVHVCKQRYESLLSCRYHTKSTVDSGFPVAVVMRAASKAHSRRGSSQKWRIQVFTNLERADLDALFAASLLVLLKVPRAEKAKAHDRLGVALMETMQDLFPGRQNLLTLYGFRDDFATRSKQKLLRQDVTMLTAFLNDGQDPDSEKMKSKTLNKGYRECMPYLDLGHYERKAKRWEVEQILFNRRLGSGHESGLSGLDDSLAGF